MALMNLRHSTFTFLATISLIAAPFVVLAKDPPSPGSPLAPVSSVAPSATPPSIDPKTVPLETEYTLAGGGEDGKRYLGNVALTRVTGETYVATWTLETNSLAGVAIRSGDVLSGGWAKKIADTNVITYVVKADGLEGKSVRADAKKIGTEILRPAGAEMASDLAGKYLIQTGKTPEGKKYGGSVVLTKVGDTSYTVKWVIGGSILHGVGLRLKREASDILTVAFPSTGTDYGAVQYVIGPDKKLKGTWMMSVNGLFTKGTEQSTQ